jgi:hypothetical protein
VVHRLLLRYDNLHWQTHEGADANMKKGRGLFALGLAGAAYALRNQGRLTDQVKAYRAVGEWDHRDKVARRSPSLKRQIGVFVAGAVGRSLKRRLLGRRHY